MDRRELTVAAAIMRHRFEAAFGSDTALTGSAGSGPSAGHCAAVAAILHHHWGGKLVSTTVCGESHWFNRIPTQSGWFDVDLTTDQFGGLPIQIRESGMLYPDSRERLPDELNPDTLRRAQALADRAGIKFDAFNMHGKGNTGIPQP